jgi:hypothetical protein
MVSLKPHSDFVSMHFDLPLVATCCIMTYYYVCIVEVICRRVMAACVWIMDNETVSCISAAAHYKKTIMLHLRKKPMGWILWADVPSDLETNIR